jgi:hypothetical protein
VHGERREHRPGDRAAEANGGRLVAPKFHIPTVGTIAYIADTEGNVVGLSQPNRAHDRHRAAGQRVARRIPKRRSRRAS